MPFPRNNYRLMCRLERTPPSLPGVFQILRLRIARPVDPFKARRSPVRSHECLGLLWRKTVKEGIAVNVASMEISDIVANIEPRILDRAHQTVICPSAAESE